MNSCNGCYYEYRPPMEGCNTCYRDDDGDLTGWTSRDQPGNGESAGVEKSPQSAAPTAPLCKGGLEAGAGETVLKHLEVLDDPEATVEEVLLLQIAQMQEELDQLRDKTQTQKFMIEQQQKVIAAATAERDQLQERYEETACELEHEHGKYQNDREEFQLKNEKLEEENRFLRKSCDWEKHERDVAEAKLEMIYLIFGGCNHG